MKLNAIIVAGIVFQAGLVASAQELKPLKYGRTVQPKRFAWTDADGRMISPWIQVGPSGGIVDTSHPLLYDNFEAVDGLPVDHCYGHDCAQPDPTSRWFFGTGTDVNQRQFVVDDMVVAPGAEGVPASRFRLAYYLGPCPGSGGESQVYIGITMYDDVSTDCQGFDCDGNGTPDCPAINPLAAGLVIDLGPLECNAADGYSIVVWDADPDPLPMPPDGQGGYSITIASAYDGQTGEFTLAEAAQMMLWGNTDLKIDNPSHQEVQYWVDRNADQLHAIPDECFSAFFPQARYCPHEQGVMIAFYGAPGQPGFEGCTGQPIPGDCDQPCDMNCDGTVNALDIEPFLDLLFGPNPKPCNTCTGDTNGDGMINALDIEPFLNCLFP